jgi:peptidoglycan/LPS O-acetylase OafA/YrhL
MSAVTSIVPTVPAAGRRPHLPALDGLRGVAILGVLLFHTGHLSGGFLGVDLFFALSGYLITDLLLREIEATGSVSLVGFWGRRIRRLLPALAAMLVGVTVLVQLTGPADLVRTTLTDGPWAQASLINWHLLAESASYWERFGQERLFAHLWSIAVEEQFYLVWPVVMAFVARCTRRVGRWTAVIAVGGSVLSLATMIVLSDVADQTRVYTGTDTRAFSLLLGAVVAVRPVRAALARVAGRQVGAMLTVGAVGLGAVWILADGVGSPWLFTGGLFAHSLAAALLIGLCAQEPRTLLACALAWQPLRWLGSVSYSLYLWHWPVVVLLTQQRTGLEGWAHTVVVCVLSTGLAALSKYLVEDPVRFHARWSRGRSGAVAFAAVMIGLALMWLMMPSPAPPVIDTTNLD